MAEFLRCQILRLGIDQRNIGAREKEFGIFEIKGGSHERTVNIFCNFFDSWQR